jgi:hypothetical protein
LPMKLSAHVSSNSSPSSQLPNKISIASTKVEYELIC